MKKITFYYLTLCPRSYFSLKNLKKVIGQGNDYEIEVKKVLFIKKNSKLCFSPLIESENRVLTGFFLSQAKINKFIRSLNGR